MKYNLLLCSLFLSVQLIFPQSQKWKIFNTSNSQLPSNSITNLALDDSNNIWVATDGSGIVKFNYTDYSNWAIYDTSNSNIPANSCSTILVDSNNTVWLGGYTSNFRLAKFDGSQWTVYNQTNSQIPYGGVNSIIQGHEGLLWMLSGSDGPLALVSYDKDTTWNVIGVNNYAFMGTRKLAEDSLGNKWIGSWNHLEMYNGDSVENFSFYDFGQYITDLKIDKSGNVWVAGGLAGWGVLTKFDGTNYTSYPNAIAISIAFDNQNNIWTGTEEFPNYPPADTTLPAQLEKFDGTNWTIYNHFNSPLPNTFQINDLQFDKLGNLWIATMDSGLVEFNENGIITPVELTSFTASIKNYLVQLNWETASEQNNEGFEIERRVVGNRLSVTGEWDKIGFVQGNGTTTKPKSYSFADDLTHTLNLTHTLEYRLKQIDYNGESKYSKTIEVKVNIPDQYSLEQNYPNPFNPATKIKYSIARDGNVNLKVLDILGREVKTLVNENQKAGKYTINFDASVLSSGIYFYSLESGSFKQVKKMILLK